MFKYFTIISAVCFCAGTVSAQSVSSGFYIDGNVQAEYLLTDDDSFTVGVADVTLGFSGAAGGHFPLGFEVDILAFEGDGLQMDPTFTGAVYYENSIGRLSLGLPRVALDDYVSTAAMGGSKLIGFDLEFLFKSVANIAILYTDVPYDYGVRFDGEVKGVNFGLSYHQLSESYLVATGAVQFDFSEIYTAAVGFELFDESGVDPGVFGSLSADYGIYGGLLSIASPTGTTEVVYAAEAFYEPSENIDFVTGFTSIDGDNIFSFDAEYTFLKNAYVGASVLGDFSGDPLYTIYAGWNINFGG